MDLQPPAPPAVRQLWLSVWCPRVGEFSARVFLADGTEHEFDSPFELVRFLSAPPAPPVTSGSPGGLR